MDPNLVEALKCKGDIYSKLKKYDDALSCYDQAFELAPNFIDVNINKGVIF